MVTMNNYAEFSPDHIQEMAIFASELTRQGIRYFIAEYDGRYRVTITGY
jgi:hypothetical protein